MDLFRHSLEQIERLLDLTALTNASTHLEVVLGRMRRAGRANEAQLKLDSARNQLEAVQIRRADNERRVEDKEREISDLKRRRDEIDRLLRRSREMTAQLQEGQLRGEIADRRERLESLSFDLLATLPPDAPLLAHPVLTQQALERVQSVLRTSREGFEGSLRAVLERVPGRLLDEPQHPPEALSTGQVQFLKRKLALLLQTEIDLAGAARDQALWSIDSGRAEKLDAVLRNFASAESTRATASSQLQEVARLKREILERELRLASVGGLTAEKQQKYTDLQQAKVDIDLAIEQLNREIGELQANSRTVAVELEKFKTLVHTSEKEAVLASRNEIGVGIAQRMFDGMRVFKEKLREQRRVEIEKAFNKSFKQLMDSHQLIARIRLDEDFRFTYLDSRGEPVGSANISAGMKQLAAQAFLWALGKVSGHQIPLVIDTPLARIDAAHQRRLITEYYPNAGKQVIVLPTDSELDKEKYRLLKPHIVQEFRLDNPTGEETEVFPEKLMYGR